MSMSLSELRAYPSNIVPGSFLDPLRRSDFGKHKDHLNSEFGNGSFRVYCHLWSGGVLLKSINTEPKFIKFRMGINFNQFYGVKYKQVSTTSYKIR